MPEIPRGASTRPGRGALRCWNGYGDGLADTSLKVIHGPDWQHAPPQIPSDRPRRCQPAGDLGLNERGHTRSHTSPGSVSNVGSCTDNTDECAKQNWWTDTHSGVSSTCGAVNAAGWVEHSQKVQGAAVNGDVFSNNIYISAACASSKMDMKNVSNKRI